jgi:hypothetical protein
MAILWVYLPKYSTTDFGLPNGFLANTTQGLRHKSFRICSYSVQYLKVLALYFGTIKAIFNPFTDCFILRTGK